jgi:flagellar L-ring protein FlgH
LELSSSSSSNGTGTIDRTESIEIKLAAVVSQVLPNGNLVIHGRQETRVNFEIRELQIAGVIRPQDITNVNTVAFENIAEARVAYGGRGHISDVQQPRYGQQIIDIIFPF